MRTIKKILTLTAMAAALQACGGSDSVGPDLVAEPAEPEAPKAVFDPSAGGDGLPFPVDLLFASSADGSINIPGKPSTFVPTNPATLAAATGTLPAAALADPQTALNTMDGFSTTAPMVVRFSDSIDDSTIKDNVRVFRLTTADPGANEALAPLAVEAELQFGVDFVAGSSGTNMLVQPLRPLESGRTHIVVVENGLTTTAGEAFDTDTPYGLLQGAFLLSQPGGGALGAVGGKPDFVLQADGTTSCDLSDLAGLAACTDVNTEDYQAVVDNVPPAAAGAGLIGSFLSLYEGAGQVSTLIQLEQLRRITAKHLGTVAAAGVDPQQVVLSYSITTENVSAALNQAKAKVDGLVPYDFPPATTADVPTIDLLNPKNLWDDGSDLLPYEVASPRGAANIFLANLGGVLQFVDPDAPNSSIWEAGTKDVALDLVNWGGGPCAALPAAATGSSNLVACNSYNPVAKKADHSIPVLISAPNDTVLAGCPAGDLPVVIYQHGITSSRGSLMAIADSLASQCVIGVAIDLPKHGIAPSGDTFSQLSQLHQGLQQIPGPNPTPVLERLVQVSSPADECEAGTGVAISDTATDFYCPSGDYFINLANLANARDSLRQAVVDLHSLYRALADNDNSNTLTTNTIGRRIDVANINFVGVSLGGIVGTPFLAQQGSNIATATLNVAGGGIAKILDGSPQIEPRITTGLFKAGGIVKPSGDYEAFLIVAQTLIDNVDPINYAESVAAAGTPILAQEVLEDRVVPNNVFGASFGPAWGLVAQTGQTGFLADQNPNTVPVGLSGTDPLTQGTGFALIGGAVQAGQLDAATALGLGPLGGDTVAGAPVTFKGMNLPTVAACGAASTNGVVRFTSGYHGSMLDPNGDPAANPLVTGVMQKQLATFVVSGGTLIADDTLAATGGASANVVLTPAVPSASTAACAP